jgi:hypothetical protein
MRRADGFARPEGERRNPSPVLTSLRAYIASNEAWPRNAS